MLFFNICFLLFSERERERNIDTSMIIENHCLLHASSHNPALGINPATQAYSLDQNPSFNLSVHRLMLHRLKSTGFDPQSQTG